MLLFGSGRQDGRLRERPYEACEPGYLDLQANSAHCVTLVMIFLGLGFLIDLCCKGYVLLRLKSLRRSLH